MQIWTMSDDTSNQERDKLLFDLIKGRLEQEWTRVNDLDTKASNLVGFVSIASGLLLGIGTFARISQFGVSLALIFLSGAGLLISSIFFGMMAMRIRKWQLVPDSSALIRGYKDQTTTIVLRRTGGEMAKVTKEIANQNNKKARLIEYSWYSLITGLVTVFVFVSAITLFG